MMTDPIADFLTRIRNALMIKRGLVRTKDSKISRRIAEILEKNGYIEGVAYEGEGLERSIVLKLKYDTDGKPVIDGLKRISRPGLRIYMQAAELPKVLGGLGLAIVSTSKGVITCKDAQDKNVGGEILCHVW